jgi:Scabin-like
MAGPHIIHLGTQLQGAEKRIEICHDRAMTTIWLELTNTEYIINGSRSPGLVKVLIGAVLQGPKWVPIGPGPAARFRDVSIALGTSLASATGKFQKAIVDHWKGFNSAQAGKWAKGTTFGTSFTSASFVMKALKTGFDAIGQAMSAYSGFRTADFTVADVLRYLGNRTAAAGATLFDAGLLEFEEIGPMAAYEPPYVQDRASVSDTRMIPYIASAKSSTHGGQFAYKAETSGVPYERVIAYGFRGDSRPPSAMKNAGGFLPNYTRAAHIEKNVHKAQDQALNLQTFIANQEYGGYLSVTKSVAVAKGFAIGMGGTAPPGAGWVYACFVEGGFHLPAKGAHAWVKYNEQEISMPGILDWDDIVGCRSVQADGNFLGNVYLKSALAHQDPKAAVKIWELLSGASQGSGL